MLAFVGRADPAFRPSADSAYRGFRAAWGERRYPYVSDSATAAWIAGAARVRAHVEARRSAYAAAARASGDSAAAGWAAEYAAVAHLAARLSVNPESPAWREGFKWRDSAMAATVPFDPAPPNSVAGVLASFGAPCQFVDLRGAAAARDGRWLVAPRPMLGVGWAVVDDPYFLGTLEPYDGLVFVRHTTPLRPLPGS